MSRECRSILLVLSLLLFLSANASAQQTGGSIEGTIKDPQGAVIPNAAVSIEGINVGFNRTVQSNQDGVYRVQEIPPGRYKVTVASVSGFGEKSVEATVGVEKTTAVNIELSVGAQAINVEVVNDPIGVNVDSTDSKIQTNISSELIQLLPKSPSFASLLKVSPATRPEPISGQFQVDGASGSENSFVIDGQDVTDYRVGTLNSSNNIPTSIIQEVQIKTSGFEAEHGGASGGVVVISTRGGSDRWSGEFGTQFGVSKLQALGTSADGVFQFGTTQTIFSIQQPRTGGTNTYPTATLSGPVIKRRLWVLGSYSPQIFTFTRDVNYYLNNPTNLVINPAFSQTDRYRAKNTFNYAFSRVDAAITNNIRTFASFLWNPQVQEGSLPFLPIAVGGVPTSQNIGGTNYTGPDLAALEGGRINQNLFTTQTTWTPNGKSIVSVRYGRGFANQKLASYAIPNETRFQCSGLASSPAYTTGSAGCPRLFQNTLNNFGNLGDINIRNTFNADLSYIANFAGSHNFKGGYEFGTVKNEVSQGFPDTGIVNLQYGRDFSVYNVGGSCAAIPNCIGVGRLQRFGTKGVASNQYHALYFQDKWQPVRRLSLNLGIRAEKEDLPAFNAGQGRVGEALSFDFGKKIAPRLGASYDPFGDGKTRIFASYGLFYDRLKFDLPRGSFGGDFFRLDYFPILSTNPQYNFYTPSRILGNFSDPVGGGNPSTAGGLGVLQVDFRIPANLAPEQYTALGLPIGGVDPDLKPFTQSEFTVGVERELSKLFVLSARFTRKNVENAIEDQANLGFFESESYIIGNPGKGFAFEQRQAAGYVRQTQAQRLYRAFEVVLNKRLSSNYFFSANYTFSRLEGNYSGLASSDEVTGGVGRTAPGVNRFFDYVNNGFTALGEPDNGPLATDRPHVFKAYGGYTFDWFKSKTNSTTLSFFTTIQSGTPQTTFVQIVQTSVVLSRRGDLGRTPTNSSTDLALSHKYAFGADNRFKLIFDVNFTNVFNQSGITSLNTTKYLNTPGLTGNDLDPCYDIDGIRPPTCAAPLPVHTVLTQAINNVLNGLAAPLLTELDNEPGNVSILYGKPASYQAPRTVRFGFRFVF
jgi:hypothetical protein